MFCYTPLFLDRVLFIEHRWVSAASVGGQTHMNNSLVGQRIGFVGLGNMGAPMARHLQAAGAQLFVWNRSPGPRHTAEALGMTSVEKLPDLAAAIGPGAICVNLTTTEVVEAVVFGPGGIHEGLDAGSVMIDFGTTGVPATKCFAQRVTWVDCCRFQAVKLARKLRRYRSWLVAVSRPFSGFGQSSAPLASELRISVHLVLVK